MKRLSPDKETDIGVIAKRLQKRVSAKEARKLIAAGKATLLSRADSIASDFYLLDDNRFMILMQFGGDGVMYPSREAYEDLMARGRKYNERIFGSSGSLVSIEAIKMSAAEFKQLIGQAPWQLSEKLGIQEEKLDYSATSLDILSKELGKYSGETIYLELLPQLVAYCGEIMKRMISGSWRIIGSSDGTLTEISIDPPNNPKQSFNPCRLLVGVALHSDGHINLKAQIDSELGKYGLIQGIR